MSFSGVFTKSGVKGEWIVFGGFLNPFFGELIQIFYGQKVFEWGFWIFGVWVKGLGYGVALEGIGARLGFRD